MYVCIDDFDVWFGHQDELMEGASAISMVRSRRSVDTMSQASEDERTRRKPGRKSLSPEESLKKRLNTLYKTVHEHQVRKSDNTFVMTYPL